jgi:hypothetical protein
MRFKTIVLPATIFLAGLSGSLHSQAPSKAFRTGLYSGLERLRDLRRLSETSRFRPGIEFNDDDLVVGLTDPDEQVVITADTRLDGNILVLNRGVLTLEDIHFQLNGDIEIYQEGRIRVENGTFTILQEYIYQHRALVAGDGLLTFSGVSFRSSGQSWSVAVAERGQYEMDETTVDDGFITTALLGEGTCRIYRSRTPGEFLCFERSSLSVRQSDLLLFWIVLSDGARVHTSLPSDSLVIGWTFPPALPQSEGIDYQVEIDSCTQVMWGLISESGSWGRFTDTEFRTVGLMFTRPESLSVSNLTNESFFGDDRLDIPDRDLYLANTEVHTWNFYPSCSSTLTVSHSVFGELLGQDSSRATVINSLCDGTGGYLGAFHNSFLLVINSFIHAQVISRDRGVLVGAESSFWGSEIDADESSVMFIANTAAAVEPEAHESAVIFQADCPPVEGAAGEPLPVFGTARILSGPRNPVTLTGYTLAYAENSENPFWSPIGGLRQGPVKDDTLGIWDTTDLLPGLYLLQLTLHHSYGDSVSMVSHARLEAGTAVAPKAKPIPESFTLFPNFPNPFNSTTSAAYHLPRECRIHLTLLDLQGRIVKTIWEGVQEAGTHYQNLALQDLPSGVYILHMRADSWTARQKITLLK